MTTLDQAFVKAFAQQGATTGAPPLAPLPTSAPQGIEAPPTATAKTGEHRPLAGTTFGTHKTTPGSELFSEVLAILDQPPERTGSWLRMKNDRLASATVQPPDHKPVDIAFVKQAPGELPKPKKTVQACAPSPTAAPTFVSEAPPRATTKTIDPGAKLETQEKIASLPGTKAAWQVERFIWPRTCQRLLAKAKPEWERLSEALLTLKAEGKTTLAFTACRRGEGATTLLLCVANLLSQRGLNLVMADADLERPRLAKRLGLQPQRGWNEIASEESGIKEALIESTAENLTLLAAAEAAENDGRLRNAWNFWPGTIKTLKKQFDLVLIDTGPLGDAGVLPFWASEGNSDTVLLIHNPRLTTLGQTVEAQRRLAAAGITVAGVIENFAEG